MTPSPARSVTWEEVRPQEVAPTTPQSRGRVLVRSLVPGLVVAGVFVLLDRPTAAALIIVAASSVSVAAALSDRFHARFQRLLQLVARGVSTGLSVVLLGLVEALVIAPLSFVLWLFRRDPLRLGSAARSDTWEPPSIDPSPQRPYTVEPTGPPATGARRVVRAVPRVVGWVALVVAADLILGSVWHRMASSDGDEATVAERVAEATRDQPWFADYLEELEAVRQDFAPFVQTAQRDVEGRYINLSDGVRRSYEPAAVAEDVSVVWFFGGTNAWGEGQRDEHTIASEVARLAEDAGHPVRVRNFAQRGDVNFAAVLRLEQALAGESAPPDLVVFADGPDDYLVQRQTPSQDPGQYGVDTVRETLVREPDPSLWQRYSDASLVHRVIERVRVQFSVQAAWAGTADTMGASATDEASGEADLAAHTASVYERGRRLAVELADRHEVPVRFFWLPVEGGDRADSEYAAAADLLHPSVTDLRGALDGADGPVYLDGAQVNERGARLVAEAMYRSLAPQLEELTGAS